MEENESEEDLGIVQSRTSKRSSSTITRRKRKRNNSMEKINHKNLPQDFSLKDIEEVEEAKKPKNDTREEILSSHLHETQVISDSIGNEDQIGDSIIKVNSIIKSKKPISTFRRKLPVYNHRDEILYSFKTHRTLIVAGETGSGKSTQIPQYLVEEAEHYLRELDLLQSSSISQDQLEKQPKKKLKTADQNKIDMNAQKHKVSKMIVITQPRRVAAINVAKRVSEEMGSKLGKLVGYSVRFDETTSNETKLKYVTDGVLLREAMTDELLSKYSVIVLDEAHERSLQTDILLGLIKNIMRKRSDLRVIVMSATLDINLYSNFFPDPTVIKVAGRQYPVDILYLKKKSDDIMDIVCNCILQVHDDLNDAIEENEDGSGLIDDILVFLPGQEDIENMMDLIASHTECQDELKLEDAKETKGIITIDSESKRFPNNVNNKLRKKAQLVPLYAALPPEEQVKAFTEATPGYRKIILATNIAETSVTISGVKVVIDSMTVKQRYFIPETNMDSLMLKRVSKAQAKQRAGRAGRECHGFCYRLLTEDEYVSCEQNTSPEIERVNLAQVILQLLVIRNGDDPVTFDFISRPSTTYIRQAIEELKTLQCIKPITKDPRSSSAGAYQVTEHGFRISLLPLTPLLAHLLLLSQKPEYSCTYEVILAVSMLSVESPFYKPSHSNKIQQERALKAHKRFLQTEGDLPSLVRVIQNWKSVKGDKRWCLNNYINHKNMSKANEVLNQLRRLLEKMNIDVMISCGGEFDRFLDCIAHALSTNVARRIPQGHGAYKMLGSGKEVYIHPSSSLHGRNPPPEAIAFIETQVTSKTFVRQVTMINPATLSRDVFADSNT